MNKVNNYKIKKIYNKIIKNKINNKIINYN